MPRSTKAEYRHHYLTYQGRPEQIAKRSQRNAARDDMEKKVGKAALAGKDVGHKTPIKSGGTNAPKNLRVESVAKNRGWQKPKR